MSEQVTLDAEFLRRALSQGPETSSADVVVTPGALPPDFPVTLPGLTAVRVLGGVRSAARWTFGASSSPESAERQARTDWRAFLDVPAPQPEVMEALVSQFAEQGWQAAQMFQEVFVEATRSQWLGARAQPPRTLGVNTRQEGGVTQVGLTVTDTDPEHVAHLLGRAPHPHFHDHFEAPLPTLTLPDGWRAQMVSGQGGPVRSLHFALICPQAAFDPAALLSHLLPQFGRQGWRLLHCEDAPESLSVYRTPLGVGTLTLRAGPGERVSALIVHATAEEGRGPSQVMFSVGSS